MISRIKQLPPSVANQIAAGEVIERPASVVKELLENAADAKATRINIEIGFGGLNQIKISDNGTGILAEDLPLAIAAHATSKISLLNDLYSIKTLGFRGEALASIASISRLEITSKPAEQDHAMMLSNVSGNNQLMPCARTQGTTIDVKDIFYNAPVRKKFLKSERGEFLAIEQVVRRFAMSLPEITIALTHNGKPILNLPAANNPSSILTRMTRLLGKEFVENSIELDVSHGGLQLCGWLGNLNFQRNQNDKQWIYVNERMVKDKLLQHAIKQAYEPFLYPGKHPGCLLYLTIDANEIDVNVHPTKHEVRFQQPRLVHDFIISTIQEVLKTPTAASSQSPLPLKEKSPVWQANNLEFRPELPITAVEQKVQAENYLLVDERFYFFNAGYQVFLADLPPLYQVWFKERLTSQSLPLANRPLLVPMHCTLPPQVEKIAEQHRELLAKYGIVVEQRGNFELLIRSLPVFIPHLNIRSFLDDFFANTLPDQEQMIALLATHQTINLLQNELEYQDFFLYLKENAQLIAQTSPFCKQISGSLCNELMHV